MPTASFHLWALPLLAFLLLFNSVDASSKTRKLLTGNKHTYTHTSMLVDSCRFKTLRHFLNAVAAPEVPVVNSTCELSTVEGDTVTFSNPE